MAEKYVTVAGAGVKDGTDWSKAFGLAEFDTDWSSAAAGDTYWIEEGTYTFTSDISTANDGTGASPIRVVGVNSGTTNEPPIYSDWATGANRPLFAGGGYMISGDNFCHFINIRYTGTDTSCIHADTGALVLNCDVNNSSSSARIAVNIVAGQARAINCEVQSGGSTKGTALDIGIARGTIAFGCYCHDSATGIAMNYRESCAMFNIIDTCDVGITLGSEYGQRVINNSIYNCTTGIIADDTNNAVIMNNSISDCTTGANWTTEQLSNWFDYNNWYNNSTDCTNCTKGPNATAVDPQYTGAAGGDFSLNTASAMIGAAFSIEEGVG